MNNTIRRQSGMTLVGFVLLLGLLLFAAYVGMKIVPAYIDYFSIVNAMEAVATEPGIAGRPPREIQQKLYNRLYVNYADDLGRDSVHVIRARDGVVLRVEYEVREALFGNLDVCITFKKSVVLR